MGGGGEEAPAAAIAVVGVIVVRVGMVVVVEVVAGLEVLTALCVSFRAVCTKELKLPCKEWA